MVDPTDIQRRVRAAFQSEYPEQIALIRRAFENWPPDGERLEEAFRMAHSMKGGARVCDFKEVEDVAHRLESHLAALLKGEIEVDASAGEELGRLIDEAEDLLTRSGTEEESTARAADNSREPETLRVGAVHLDHILQSTGQLVTETVRQEAIAEDFREIMKGLRSLQNHIEASGDMESLRSEFHTLAKQVRGARDLQAQSARTLRTLSERLRREVSLVRLVAVGSVLEGFPRMVRDLATEANKSVRLEISGWDHQVDRLVLQTLKDPVMHALRNALAHGIESRRERRQAGKSEEGLIKLSAEIRQNRLLLSVADDGRGLHLDAIRKKAIAQELISAEVAAEATDEELIALIFRPGFSTSEELSTLAGRGVGLSVVREAVAHLQGSVQMRAGTNGGSVLEINVPVGISAHRLILIRLAGRVYAVPATSIRSIQRVREVEQLEGRTTVRFLGKPVPLASPAGLTGKSLSLVRSEDGWLYNVIVQIDTRLVAVNVEEVIGELNAFIKPLPYPASLSPHFSGGVILEDGSLAMVLDVPALFERTRGAALTEGERQVAAGPARKPIILVVDDSFTARTLQKSIFEAAGYTVRIAVDGEGALLVLKSEPIDLVVSDIQMPRMDGFTLLETMKAQVALAEIPVILVTSLSSVEDQERGLALGADAYIVKERFDHGELLASVRRLL